MLKKYKTLVYNNNIFEWIDKLESLEGGFEKVQFLFSTLSFEELGFLRLELNPFMFEVVENPPKRDLSSSKFMNRLLMRK